MSASLRFHVDPTEAGRVDRIVLARFPGSSRRRVAALFAEGGVRLDGALAKKGDVAAAGAEITLAHAPITDAELRVVAETGAPVVILYVDEDLVALAKPAGVPSHPLAAREVGTLANALVARFPECAELGDDPREAGLAHRLDTGTSGVILAARTQAAWRALRDAFAAHRVDKRYLALVAAVVSAPGESARSLARSGDGRRARIAAVEEGGLPARTVWTVARRLGGYTLLSCESKTGRMHQIRVHLADRGWPIVGDELYGGPAPPAPLAGHFLHAAGLALAHPRTGARLVLEAPLPLERQALVDALVRGQGSSE
jgi:23S rRNA pseudouridine1911/1915/1917 synthase